MKLVRYADDFVMMLYGTRADADVLWDEVGAVLAPMGLRLPVAKTRFSATSMRGSTSYLGWRIQRRAWRSRSGKTTIHTYPSKKTLASIIDKVRALARRAKHRTLADLLRRLNPVLRAGRDAGTAVVRTDAGALCTVWSPEQISHRLKVDFPDDESMRISHATTTLLCLSSGGSSR